MIFSFIVPTVLTNHVGGHFHFTYTFEIFGTLAARKRGPNLFSSNGSSFDKDNIMDFKCQDAQMYRNMNSHHGNFFVSYPLECFHKAEVKTDRGTYNADS